MIRYPHSFSLFWLGATVSGALVSGAILAGAIAGPAAAQDHALQRATITTLRNQVRLKPQAQPVRAARHHDALQPGDSVTTARASLAELRFNEGTLARMGERAVFRFLPQTRTVHLNQGTMLLLIPPGKGRTQVTTPNVSTGIRGSALFVRYNQETNTTVVGALTNSGIEVTTAAGAPLQVLEAGQIVVIVNDKIERLYEFDLATFYETSLLVEGLQLNQPVGDPVPAAEADRGG